MAIAINKYRMNSILILLMTVTIAITSIIMGLNNNIKVSFFLSVIGFILMSFNILTILKNYASLTMAFLGFMFLYTYSGVYSVLWGNGLNPIFITTYEPSIFINYSNIAYCSLYFGFILKYKVIHNINSEEVPKSSNKKYVPELVNRAIFCSLVSLLMEFINFYRVGGISAVSQGKAYYASMVSELSFTLPSEIFLITSCIYFSLYISNKFKYGLKIFDNKVIIYLIPTLFLFSLYLLLGMRGVILSYIMILFVGSKYLKPTNSLSFKFIFMLLIVYVLFAVIYTARASIGFYLIENNDLNGFINVVFTKSRLIEALLPTNNEFTVAFGNFNQYITSSIKDFKYGATYLIGLLILIPSFIFPGTKPLQIVYEFRNIFFPSEIVRGSIAGTGFSFLLESYMNFGFIGIIMNYFIIGFLLAKLEKNRAIKNNNFINSALYLSCFYFIGHFQRSSFADILSSIYMLFVVIILTSNKHIRSNGKNLNVNRRTYGFSIANNNKLGDANAKED